MRLRRGGSAVAVHRSSVASCGAQQRGKRRQRGWRLRRTTNGEIRDNRAQIEGIISAPRGEQCHARRP
uniref:Uncharacterized protein n=1 Tax=Oryza sativa subsp. japonica TaxID=39947 RepID=Q6Z879_ORYSJ|nr:hypothetical protein [Oryza sativa Japonica Group]